MMFLVNLIHILFPLIGILLLIIGFSTKRKQLITLALWLSLIALLVHYRTSGGEILGVYFDYTHTLIYSINLIVLVICALYLLLSYASESNSSFIRYGSSLLAAIATVGAIILMINLWINAHFIENRLTNTPLLQVATPAKLDYCNYSYIFYKVDNHGYLEYLCPNYYGLIPSTGRLENVPASIVNQLPQQLQIKYSEPKPVSQP